MINKELTDWTELKTGKEVFDRQAEGWEIQDALTNIWLPWKGGAWSARIKYRGRPQQPKKVTVTSEAGDTKLMGI